MKKLEQVSDIINKCVSYIGMVIFIVLIVACVAQVFFRFILNNSLSWSEELARYCFIWMHMLGASLVGSHLDFPWRTCYSNSNPGSDAWNASKNCRYYH